MDSEMNQMLDWRQLVVVFAGADETDDVAIVGEPPHPARHIWPDLANADIGFVHRDHTIEWLMPEAGDEGDDTCSHLDEMDDLIDEFEEWSAPPHGRVCGIRDVDGYIVALPMQRRALTAFLARLKTGEGAKASRPDLTAAVEVALARFC